jgi:hypothetical protein
MVLSKSVHLVSWPGSNAPLLDHPGRRWPAASFTHSLTNARPNQNLADALGRGYARAGES